MFRKLKLPVSVFAAGTDFAPAAAETAAAGSLTSLSGLAGTGSSDFALGRGREPVLMFLLLSPLTLPLSLPALSPPATPGEEPGAGSFVEEPIFPLPGFPLTSLSLPGFAAAAASDSA